MLPGYAVLDDREALHHALPLLFGAAGRGAEEREPLDAVGRVEGQTKGHRGAQRVARDVAPADAEMVE